MFVVVIVFVVVVVVVMLRASRDFLLRHTMHYVRVSSLHEVKETFVRSCWSPPLRGGDLSLCTCILLVMILSLLLFRASRTFFLSRASRVFLFLIMYMCVT